MRRKRIPQNIIEIGQGIICPKCNGVTVTRKKKNPPKNKFFYFTQYDYCFTCGAVYFNEIYKCSNWKEVQEQKDFMQTLF